MEHALSKLLLLFGLVDYAFGHGMMIEPVGRQSRWRVDDTAPVNTNDNELFCGGITNTWQVHNGKCGICGDDFGLPTPRPHEFGGEYGSGDIVRVYKAGTDIPITANLTANHRGYFTFDICNMDYSDETEECFIKLKIEDGSDRFYLPSPESGTYHTAVFIPRYIVCDHCVLRWQYTAGNMWGPCGDGTSALGCGPQEIFRSCADIRIEDAGHRYFGFL
ncbi:unnamed protein product [Hermetia illucens]|uniref:Chitin-binding type-4 domain-containing protein n=1 Tax=Hermetia illucens TaxID=343691 RepID=A0A7R8Z4T5_HERIL|nr:uncharacterized protein LOC119659624 [Hermetia illucens]CAD7093332.1 unnamed protein product [Hermetia illucens]